MSAGMAFVSSDAAVLSAWEAWREHVADVTKRRTEMSDRYGRRLMVNRLGFGHGTRVVGFEEFEEDKGGDLLGDNGELRVPKKGPPYSTVVANIRRKAGKDLAVELGALNMRGPDLPGMPGFQLVGFRCLAPALFCHEGSIWTYWGDDVADVRTGGEIDPDAWAIQPLSAYFAAKEAHEAAEEVTP